MITYVMLLPVVSTVPKNIHSQNVVEHAFLSTKYGAGIQSWQCLRPLDVFVFLFSGGPSDEGK